MFFFLEVKIVEGKKKAIVFGPIFGVAFFGKRFEGKKKEKQNQSNDEYRPSPTTNIYERNTCHISRGNFHDTKNLYGNLKERIQLEGGVAQYLCLKILGLRLELDKAVKCLYNTNI